VLLLAALPAVLGSDRGEYFSTSSGPVNITLIHHASLVIEGAGRTVYVDPTGEGNYKGLPKADFILITSDRPDHLDLAAIKKYSRNTTAIIAPAGPAGQLQHCTALNNGETVRMGEIFVEAEPAYQPKASDDGKAGRAKGLDNGYVLTFPGLRIYVSGDTGFYPEMKSIKNINAAFLSVGTPESMPLQDAAKAVRAIMPKTLYPYAYRDTKAEDMRRELGVAADVEVRIRNWY